MELKQTMKSVPPFLKILIITGAIWSFGILISCEETVEIPNDLDNPVDTSGVDDPDNNLMAIYINNQEDFDLYKNSTFLPGAHILFAAGQSFNGKFAPSGSGTDEEPIIIAAYDPDTDEILTEWIDNKPVINGLGTVEAPFYLKNGSNWQIHNIAVTNTDGSDGDQGVLFGFLIEAEDMGVAENIIIRNNHIYDVNGKIGEKERGGIHIRVDGNEVKTKFDNLLLENNVLNDIGGIGIATDSSWPKYPDPDFHPWTNVVIRGNSVIRTGRNGAIIRVCDGALIEYNTFAYNSLYSKGHSLMTFNIVNTVLQYNEIYGNTAADMLQGDTGAFVAGFRSKGIIFQYNYMHGNHWSVAFGRRAHNSDITIRYNISVNEIVGAYVYEHPGERELTDVKVYNNIHYFGEGAGNKVFVNASDKERIPNDTEFRNNIFYFEDGGDWVFEPDISCSFSNNLFYNLSTRGTNAVIGDPLFVNPESGEVDIDMSDPNRLAGYKLLMNSPCINAGIEINNNGEKDFWGNILYHENPEIGAHEY